MSNSTNFHAIFNNSQKSVFKKQGEEVFNGTYIPKHISHREEEMKTLANFFRSIITNPTNSSRKVILYGPVGSGKTLVSRAFGNDLIDYLHSEHTPGRPLFKFFHINCRKTKTPHLILTQLLRQLVPGFPLRGFSVDELLRIFTLLLYEQNLVCLLCLDEIDYLSADERTDFLYALSRIEESPPTTRIRSNYRKETTESRFNLLAITRDENFRYYLDSSTASSLGKNFITFRPYTRQELFDIIDYRASLGLREEAYNDELLDVITGLAEGHYGDARFAIELLWRAAKISDKEQRNRITPEHVRKAVITVLPMEKSILDDLNIHQKLLLLSIARSLQNESRTFVTTPEVSTMYNQICEEARVRPRRQTQLWTYLKDLSKLGLITSEVVNKHKRGRSLGRVSNIYIRDLPLEEIINSLNHLVEHN